MSRREFTNAQKAEIVRRAKDENETIRCEGCGLALKKGGYEVDHIIPEGLRPDADKVKPLTVADGQLLGPCCHRGDGGKTAKDVAQIAKAKRQERRDLGLTRPVAKMKSRPHPISERTARNQARERPKLPPKKLFEATR